MLSTTANPTDGLRFDGDANSIAEGPVHPLGRIAANGPPNGVGNGAGERTSGDTRSLYVRRCASETGSVGYPAVGGRYPLPRYPRHPAQHPDYRLRDGY